MSERPKKGVDPDATVMLPRDAGSEPIDPESTVMIPAKGGDPEASVMIPSPEPDPEATVAIPTPGRRREAMPEATPASPAPPAPPASSGEVAVDLPTFSALSGLNALVAAANPVLTVVAQIRHTLKHPDPAGLRVRLKAAIDAFERQARAAGTPDDVLRAASFALCCLVDESARHTPWGRDWAKASLVGERHGSTRQHEEFFTLLDQALGDRSASLELLEFFVACLALGFEGPYRGAAGGREALAAIRARLYAAVRARRTPYDGELSGHWRGVAAPQRSAPGMLGVWVAASCTALLLAALFAGYGISLGMRSDPLALELAQLKLPPPPVRPAQPARKAAPVANVASRFAAEIGRGEVAVTDAAGTSTIVIRSDELFASGSARIEPAIEPIVRRIAEVLDQVSGTIVVTGHTDDVPIRTARFPSNWELSTERAASVVRLMAGKLRDPARLTAEGLADSEPVAPNDSATNRARNRRVVVVLRSAP